MGYGVGYSTTNAIKEYTDLDKCLKTIGPMDSLVLLSKVSRNVAQNPTEEKYRRLRLTNEKLKLGLFDVPGCINTLLEMGWVKDEEDQEYLMLPHKAKVSMVEVRAIENAIDAKKKEDEAKLLKILSEKSKARARA